MAKLIISSLKSLSEVFIDYSKRYHLTIIRGLIPTSIIFYVLAFINLFYDVSIFDREFSETETNTSVSEEPIIEKKAPDVPEESNQANNEYDWWWQFLMGAIGITGGLLAGVALFNFISTVFFPVLEYPVAELKEYYHDYVSPDVIRDSLALSQEINPSHMTAWIKCSQGGSPQEFIRAVTFMPPEVFHEYELTIVKSQQFQNSSHHDQALILAMLRFIWDNSR